jgi:SPP1 gp7 family putative phage head morphogenesis protein
VPRRSIPEIPDPRGRQLAGILARDAYDRWLAREITAVLSETFREIVRQIDEAKLSGAGDQARLQQLGARVTQLLDESYRGLERRTREELAKYSDVEAQAALGELAATIRDAGGVMPETTTFLLSRGTVESIARLPIEGLPLGDWWQAQARAMTLAVRRQLQVGLTLGEGTSQIAARIIPPAASTGPAVFRNARAQATAIVRTATTAVHADADMRAYESVGERVSAEYELLTARDSRVSKICAALDGQVFRYDDPKRKVPPVPHQLPDDDDPAAQLPRARPEAAGEALPAHLPVVRRVAARPASGHADRDPRRPAGGPLCRGEDEPPRPGGLGQPGPHARAAARAPRERGGREVARRY